MNNKRRIIMNLFKTLQSHPVVTGMVAVAFIATAIAGSALAWGPGRTLFTMAHPSDHPTFDSITDNPNYGDERGFTTVKDLTAGTGNGHNTTLVPGHEYEVQVYIHNDASETLNASGVGIAHDVAVRVALSASVTGTDTVDGFISSSNATPGLIYDSANITSASKVDLEYVNGSAMLYTNHQTAKISDSVITTGVKVGSHDLSGNWLGCLDSAGYLTFKFKVKPLPVVDKDITVCRLSDSTYPVTIKESEFDTAKYSKNPADCTKMIVCRLSDKTYPVTIKTSDFDSSKYSKDVNDCNITVCRLSDKVYPVTIKASEFDSSKYSMSSADCASTVTKLPTTGAGEILGSLMGVGALSYGGHAFMTSLKAKRR